MLQYRKHASNESLLRGLSNRRQNRGSSTRRAFLTQTTTAVAAAMGSPRLFAQQPADIVNDSKFYTTNRDPQNHNDPNLHLFVDDEEIAEMKHLVRIVNKPKKHPQRVLVSDRPWEGERVQAWGSVIQEPDGLFRMSELRGKQVVLHFEIRGAALYSFRFTPRA